MTSTPPRSPIPSPPDDRARPWTKKLVGIVGALVLALVTAVVSAWVENKLDEDNSPTAAPSAAVVEPSDAAPGEQAEAQGAPPGATFPQEGPDLHCRTSVQAVGAVQWWPCARVRKDRIEFGVMLRGGEEERTIRVRFGYHTAVPRHFTFCTKEAGMPVETGPGSKTRWVTTAECSVARTPAAVQTKAWAAPETGAWSGSLMSPTLHVQPDGSVADLSRD
ncbi:hypothetical protein OEB94_00325 [Streptomyces sp. ICN988]|uniref:hypothetical protein n=1 Tax=Streptomyces sp. ICN988 TaxID=2983765 RepID=UPI0021E41BF7|nr:hypothetical protein [Streptomyces sp. ICN988]MCV2457752.1 hypothetical protein [Streptomyces sp. ICN988]